MLGAGITTVVAVAIFVVERSIARSAAYLERRRAALDAVMIAFAEYVATSMAEGRPPAAQVGANLVTARARMNLALREKDRPLGVWIGGMERRLGEAAQTSSNQQARIRRLEQIHSRVNNTLIDVHAGALSEADLIVPASLFWLETTGEDVRASHPQESAAAERPVRVPWSVWSRLTGWGIRRWRALGRTLGFIKPANGSSDQR